MSKHTPGPWTACDNNGYSIWRVTSFGYRANSASRTVAEVVGDSAETEANARLIAAAPETLELLRDVRRYVADANLRGEGYAEIDLKAIDALLAKIEGGEA
jgi:hypothetical protein